MTHDYYKGVDNLNQDLENALQFLARTLSVEVSNCDTHSYVQLNNFESDASLKAAAVYLVASIAQAIDSNLQIRAALFDEATARRDILIDIECVIGKENCNDDFKSTMRDPWIWEGLSHMLVHLSRYDPSFNSVGTILATSGVKHDVHDHGLDLIGIYDSGELGIIAGECKAYPKNPTAAILDASGKLSEIDLNERDIEIRATVNQLRNSLLTADQERLAGAFWRKERAYIPFVCCDNEAAIDWSRKRKSMRKLNIPTSKKVVWPLPLATVRSRFDQICDYMRKYPTL